MLILVNFDLKEITEENQYTDEKDYNFYANLKFPTKIFGKGGFVKLGSKLRFKNKERSNNFL